MLFSRGPDGVFLNEAGGLFRRRVGRFLIQIDEAVARVAERRPKSAPPGSLAAKISAAHARCLLAIWREGSFRAAARSLGISEPSLHRPAREIEQLLGRPLYRRTAAGLAVNDAGGEFARRLALAIGEIRSGAEETGRSVEHRTSLRLGILALAPRTILARASTCLLERDRAHGIEVVEGPYARLANELNQGSIDLIYGALRTPPPHPDMIEESLFADPYIIVCRKGHPLLGPGSRSPAALARYDWIFPDRGLPRRIVLDDCLKRWDQSRVVQFETSCLATIRALLATSNRISILSRWHIALDGHRELAGVDGLAIDHRPRVVGLTRRENWLPTPFQAAFLDEMRIAAASMCAAP